MLVKTVPKISSIEFKVHDHIFEMIEVKGGSFLMGGEEFVGDKQIHDVELSSFLIGKYPVTQSLWEEVMDDNPSHFQGVDRPVEMVNWYEATEFCNALSRHLGKGQVYKGSGENIEINHATNGFRLPTEAEWEYVARGGHYQEGYTYSGGDKPHVVGWYDGNSGKETKIVGLKSPNTLGLYDMSGNVWEWCNDWFDSTYYSQFPRGGKSGLYRVIRGGCWDYLPWDIRVTNRYDLHPEFRSNFVGFRLCLPQP